MSWAQHNSWRGDSKWSKNDPLKELDEGEDYFEDEDEYYEEEALEEYQQQKKETVKVELQVKDKNTKKNEKKNKQKSHVKKDIEKKNQTQQTLVVQYVEAPKEEQTPKVEIFNEVNFRIKVKQCSQMNLEKNSKLTGTEYTVNPEWCKVFREKFKGSDVSKLIKDKQGNPIPKFIEKPIKDFSCLKRCNFASTVNGSTLFIHGGTNLKNTYKDLIFMDTSTQEITMFNGLEYLWIKKEDYGDDEDDIDLPPLSRHQMVFANNGLFIFGGTAYTKKPKYSWSKKFTPYQDEMRFYFISNPFSVDTLQLGIRTNYQRYTNETWIYDVHPTRDPVCKDYITKRVDFSVNEYGDLYLFGGHSETSTIGLDDLYKIIVRGTNVTIEAIKKKHTTNQWIIGGRYGHTSAFAGGKLLIFGGRDGDTILNDLWTYDFIAWKEIIVNDIIPPSLYDHSMIVISEKYIMIYGGKSSNGVENTIYVCDTISKEWNIVKIMGKNDSVSGDLQVAVSGHTLSLINSSAYLIGGSDGIKTVDTNFIINDIYDLGGEYLLTEYLSTQFLEEKMTDVVIIIKDAKGDERKIKAHKVVLSCRCPYLAGLLKDKEKVEIVETIYEVFYPYLYFLYSGNLKIKGHVKEFLNIVKKWNERLHPSLEKICTNLAFNNTEDVINQLESDFSSLLNKEDYSDCSLVIGEQVIPGHKIILCRSPHFRNVFESGMSESVSNIVDLEGMEKEPILEILNFLYTDKVKVSPQHCVGVLLYSSMFQIQVLASNCRTVVSQNFNARNVCQVIQICETYGDQILKRISINYIKKNYEAVRNTSDYDSIDEKLKKEIALVCEKYEEQQMKKKLKKQNQKK